MRPSGRDTCKGGECSMFTVLFENDKPVMKKVTKEKVIEFLKTFNCLYDENEIVGNWISKSGRTVKVIAV